MTIEPLILRRIPILISACSTQSSFCGSISSPMSHPRARQFHLAPAPLPALLCNECCFLPGWTSGASRLEETTVATALRLLYGRPVEIVRSKSTRCRLSPSLRRIKTSSHPTHSSVVWIQCPRPFCRLPKLWKVPSILSGQHLEATGRLLERIPLWLSGSVHHWLWIPRPKLQKVFAGHGDQGQDLPLRALRPWRRIG